MSKRRWMLGVLTAGGVFIAVICGFVVAAVPDRPVARNWPLVGLLLFAPYVLWAGGWWLAPVRVIAGCAFRCWGQSDLLRFYEN